MQKGTSLIGRRPPLGSYSAPIQGPKVDLGPQAVLGGRVGWVGEGEGLTNERNSPVQGYLTHKKPPPPTRNTI